MSKGKRKKGKGKGKRSQPLSGTVTTAKQPIRVTLIEGGIMIAAAIAGAATGAALGRHSLIAGVPVAFYGVHKRNKYLIAAGLGLALSNGFQLKKQQSAEATQTVEGFDVKQIATEAKDRVGTFFKNFSEKLYLSPKKEDQQTAGLSGEEQVTYFVNPHSNSQELDMSAIDRIQEQIAEMSKGTAGFGSEAEREF
jgi:hypothetical protein